MRININPNLWKVWGIASDFVKIGYNNKMIYSFDEFILDTSRAELSRAGEPVAIEPKVFDLLKTLLEHSGDLLSKDELIEIVWKGRVVSDSAVTSCIKAARQVLGDDGVKQFYIKTVHGRGFRFAAPFSSSFGAASPESAPLSGAEEIQENLTSSAQSQDGVLADTDTSTSQRPASELIQGRPSIAILPLQLIGNSGEFDALAEALPHDLITELSRLRWLFVIARGSSFRFRGADVDVQKVGVALAVRYCLTGSVEFMGNKMSLNFELADTRHGGVVWADRFAATIDDVHEIRSIIISAIVSSLEIQITANEAAQATMQATENLDAWAAYHLGLRHMYRFTVDDNQAALNYFQVALRQDKNFARAHAGMSFAHFQNSFLNYTGDTQGEALLAKQFAEQGMALDALDPFVNLNMGRSFWLENDLLQSQTWLQRSIDLSPSYAQGLYSKAWTDTLSGDNDKGQANVGLATRLSPMDPLLYAFRGTRAMAHMARGEHHEGAIWGEMAANSPGAHSLIGLIAVIGHSLNGDTEKAQARATQVRAKAKQLNQQDFFRSFPFTDGVTQQKFSQALSKHGF